MSCCRQSIDPGQMTERVTLMRRVAARDTGYGGETMAFDAVGIVWAKIREKKPAREALSGTLIAELGDIEVTIWSRKDVDIDWRLSHRDVIYDIVGKSPVLSGVRTVTLTARRAR